MKITKEQLKEIIKEEIEALSEGTRFRPGSGGLPVGSPRSREEIRQQAGQVQAEVETLIAYLSQEERPPTAGLEEEKELQKLAKGIEKRGTEGDFAKYCGGKVTQKCIDKAAKAGGHRAKQASLAVTFSKAKGGGKSLTYPKKKD